MSFVFNEDELPEVTEDRSYKLGEASRYSGVTVTYFNVGDWNMSNLEDEDAELTRAREAALAWIAWYNFLEANPDKIAKTTEVEKENTNG